MKECGGGGKEGSIPHEEYVPDCFVTVLVCNICEQSFDTINELREPVKSDHKENVKTCWSKDALENIHLYAEYKIGLNKNLK